MLPQRGIAAEAAQLTAAGQVGQGRGTEPEIFVIPRLETGRWLGRMGGGRFGEAVVRVGPRGGLRRVVPRRPGLQHEPAQQGTAALADDCERPLVPGEFQRARRAGPGESVRRVHRP
ncbi:MAG: hypothetical protein ABJB47_21160 [Actinomycetota bacterium]